MSGSGRHRTRWRSTGDPATRARTRIWTAALSALMLSSALAVPVQGQGVRGWVGTTVQAVELRPFEVVDPLACSSGSTCYIRGSEQTAVVGTQDVRLTAWGFGVQGLSASMFLRGRGSLGSDAVWPRTEDHFDAVLAYAQYVRGGWTVRAGRQETRSGLGFASFDGGFVEWRHRRLQAEAYGGRSLARGLRDPANDALRGIEDFVPDQGIYLFGGAVRARYPTGSVVARYQRELLSDRSGLASERGSIDATSAFARVRLSGGMDYDFGQQQFGKGHLTATAPFGAGRWMLSGTVRRYVPYFSLSTIWGFFEPVPYHEALARVGWSPGRDVGVWVSAGRRSYGDTRTVAVLRPLEDTGWRAEAGSTWAFAESWSVQGGYQLEWGPGAFLQSGDAAVRWSPMSRLSVALTGTTFQQIEQYRLGDGRAYGWGLALDGGITEGLELSGGFSILRQTEAGSGTDPAWNQSRAWTSLRWLVGQDPGLANRRNR